ncbi:phospholipid-binding protein MlaC [Acidisphaera sp. S103]|uniref:MlaC/ttg2D family ABC transporter substrate-binding protein n=1 Tax=Acidisphaera sp. S103 TaxID=1747223 RepID=UPI00131D71C1|nr:ABC transporter substrate-binding protein [Acidisphaera sp. S103]
MTYRRHFLTFAAASALFPLSVRGQGTDKAAAFVKSTGDRLVAIVNGPGSAVSKRAAMTQVLDADVDVDGIGKFCLGRFWRQATPQQQQQYLALFHEVLVTNITSKLGEYQGVTFTMGRTKPQDEEAAVSTTVVRPNNPPTAVDWIIANPSTDPKIIDVVAEGTSLRLTQRQDYASYLTHNHDSVDALIAAMKNQVSRSG